jgi:hypothetical protein
MFVIGKRLYAHPVFHPALPKGKVDMHFELKEVDYKQII